MNKLESATRLLLPFMDEKSRNKWLTLAFSQEHPGIYYKIIQNGSTADFTTICVSELLKHGCVGSRHALSMLLDVVLGGMGDDLQESSRSLIAELDGRCVAHRDSGNPSRGVLPECLWCWWRDTTRDDIESIVKGLQINKENFLTRKRFSRLTNALFLDVARSLDAPSSREIIKTANDIIEALFLTKSAKKLIVANFDGADIANDWAGAIIDANGRGSHSLIALLLSMYLFEGCELRSLADANLQLLHKNRR